MAVAIAASWDSGRAFDKSEHDAGTSWDLRTLVLDAGDYYLARSIYGDFSVQIRQYKCSTTVSCISGVRIRYGNSVINFDYDNR